MAARHPHRTEGVGDRTRPPEEPAVRDDRRRRFERDVPPADPIIADEPVAAPPPGSWRDQVAGLAGLNVIVGIWLIISPWVLGYSDGDAVWNPIISGALVVILALSRLAMPARTMAASAINAAIGVWLFISGFWLADSGQASWNAWIFGVVVFVLAAAALGGGEDRRRTVPA